MGLIAARDRERIRQRHIEDSLRALTCIRGEDRQIVDLGSGAGLPGIPLAIALPDRSFVLIEARRRRAAFLELAVEETGLHNVRVQMGQAEDVSGRANLCLARAFAPAPNAWRVARRLLLPGGRLVYFAGRDWTGPGGELEATHVSVEICAPRQFTWQGPLVIMGRLSSTDGSQHHEPKHL
jgi:16S rRNA (guanine527-N7)-methyltransferase